MSDSYFGALNFLDNEIAGILQKINIHIVKSIQEIRLRSGRPLCVIINGEIYFINENCGLSKDFRHTVTVKQSALKESVRKITGNSVYSHTDEILNGFISMPYGNRAGIAGVFRQGKFCEISSLNIRIAHECINVAKQQVRNYFGGSVLICGPPASGKTTFLRDLIRGLSNGDNGRYYKISLIDTRGEIAACFNGTPQNDVGINTDVFSGREKADGTVAAIRSMSPEIVAFDEIGTPAELEAVKNSINCGTYIITTAHIGDINELYKRNVTKTLLKDCEINRVIFLKSVGVEPINIEVKEGKLCL